MVCNECKEYQLGGRLYGGVHYLSKNDVEIRLRGCVEHVNKLIARIDSD